VNFTGNASTDDVAVTGYSWNFGDGSPVVTTANATHTYSSAGSYTAVLTVTDGSGLVDTESLGITVTPPQGSTTILTLIDADLDVDLLTLSNNQQINSTMTQGKGLNIRANTNPAVVGSVYIALSGPVNATITENVAPYALFGDVSGNYNPVALPVGNYTLSALSYSGKNRAGTLLETATLQFSIVAGGGGNQAPVAVASATPLSGTAPLVVNFTGSNSTDDVAVTGYSWNFGDGSPTATTANPSHTYSTAGSYTAVLTVTDGGGLTNTASINITVSNPPVNQAPVAVASATPLSGTAPLNVNFTGSASTDDVAVTGYSWNFGDGSPVVTTANATHTYSSAGSYTAVLTVTDGSGLQDTESISITVSSGPQNGIVSLTLIDADQDVDLFNLSNGQQISAAVTQGKGLNIRANTNPAIVGSVYIALSGPVNATITENVAPYALFGDVSGNYNPVSFPLGNYTLSATNYSGRNRTGTAGQTVTLQFSIVQDNPNKGSTSGLNPDDIDAQNGLVTPLSGNTAQMDGYLFPNPATSHVFLQVDPSTIVKSIIILDMSGRVINRYKSVETTVGEGLYRLEISNLESGVYNVVIENQTSKGSNYKLIVRN
jgi:PKD repeat protein